MIIVYLILWILYSILEGIREARYFDVFPRPPKRYDIHLLFSIQRLIVIIALSQYWLVGICYCLIFPFIHDGVYYMVRNKLNVVTYTKGFWSNPSPTSTAVMSFSLLARIILFAFGITGLIFFWIITNK